MSNTVQLLCKAWRLNLLSTPFVSKPQHLQHAVNHPVLILRHRMVTVMCGPLHQSAVLV